MKVTNILYYYEILYIIVYISYAIYDIVYHISYIVYINHILKLFYVLTQEIVPGNEKPQKVNSKAVIYLTLTAWKHCKYYSVSKPWKNVAKFFYFDTVTILYVEHMGNTLKGFSKDGKIPLKWNNVLWRKL